MLKPLFDDNRVESPAEFIAAELKTLLDRHHYDNHMSRRIAEGCPAYEGLTNGERVLATLRA